MASTFEALLLAQNNLLMHPPEFRMYQSITQAIANSTDTQITCDAVSYDSFSGRSGTSPYSYTIPPGMTGHWQFTWAVATGINSAGARDAYILQNGSRITAGSPTAGAAANNDYTQSFGVTTIPAQAGDVISLWFWQNSGGSLNTAVGAHNASLFEGRLVSFNYP